MLYLNGDSAEAKTFAVRKQWRGPDRHRHEVTLSVAPQAVTLSAAKGA